MHNTFSSAQTGGIGSLDLLSVLGVALFGGTIGARIFQKLRIPQVVGYITIGILAGESVFKLIRAELVQSFIPLNLFALGIIGLMIGGELKYEVFKKYGKQFITILLTEGLFACAVVTLLTTLAAGFLSGGNWRGSIALGLVLGAISSATAPAATVDVLWEYKARGILTRTILAVVALDDGLALLLYGFASSIAGRLLGSGETGLVKSFLLPLWEIGGGIAVGFLMGLVLIFVIKSINDPSKILAFSIASVLLVMGISRSLQVESILAAMVLGAVLANLAPRRSQNVFKNVEKFSPPIYVLFFVLVGARLKLSNMPMWVLVVALVYVLGRSIGKISGSWFGAFICRSPSVVRKYLGICLFSQAGVAIGLSILASERFGSGLGESVILVITTTTFLVQIIGPPLVKLGVKKAGEVGLNVTEEDLIQTYKVADVMDSEVPLIYAGTPLNQVIKTVSSTGGFYYPVVDNDNNLIGAITLDGIRNTFTTQELNDWLVALDIAEPVVSKMVPDVELLEAMEDMRQLDIQYLPVVASKKNDNYSGVLDMRAIRRRLSAEVLAKQREADRGYDPQSA